MKVQEDFDRIEEEVIGPGQHEALELTVERLTDLYLSAEGHTHGFTASRTSTARGGDGAWPESARGRSQRGVGVGAWPGPARGRNRREATGSGSPPGSGSLPGPILIPSASLTAHLPVRSWSIRTPKGTHVPTLVRRLPRLWQDHPHPRAGETGRIPRRTSGRDRQRGRRGRHRRRRAAHGRSAGEGDHGRMHLLSDRSGPGPHTLGAGGALSARPGDRRGLGIATPAGVLDALRRYPAQTVTSIETITVVDPLRFEALYEVLTPLIESQIIGADRVVVMKADQATPEEVEAALRTVAALAPAAPAYVVDATRAESLEPLVAALGLAMDAGAQATSGEAAGLAKPAASATPGQSATPWSGAASDPAPLRPRGRAAIATAPGAGCTPPSAAGHLEPYGARVVLRAERQPLDPEGFLVTLVEDLAAVERRRRSFGDRSYQVSASHSGRRARLQSHVGADGGCGEAAGGHPRDGDAANR